jgi:hypothetical protein
MKSVCEGEVKELQKEVERREKVFMKMLLSKYSDCHARVCVCWVGKPGREPDHLT